MPLRPGELLGLPAGVPDVLGQVASFRYLLVVLAVVWALAAARLRPWLALLFGVVFFEVATGFWVLGLGRPYGLLVDPTVTRRAAEIGVASAVGGGEGFLTDVPAPTWWSVRLAAAGMPPSWLLLAPSFLPMVVPLILAILIHLLARPPERTRAALLWLAFGSGHLDALSGFGLLGGLWLRPASAAGIVAALAVVLLLLRRERAYRFWPLVAAAVVAGLALLPAQPSPGVLSALLALTLDQSVWWLLGGYGLLRGGASAASRALVAAGALTVVLSALVPPLGLDAWSGHALYRVGLVLAAAGPVGHLCERLGASLARWPVLAGLPSARLGLAAVLALGVPGAFVTWWDPPSLDPVADMSRSPIPPALADAMAWIRRETPHEAVFAADAAHAPAVAALGGRRVLRAPTLVTPPDDDERWALEQNLLEGHVPRRALPRYGVSHLFLAPRDYADRGLAWPEVLDAARHLRLLYRNADGYRVYAVIPRS